MAKRRSQTEHDRIVEDVVKIIIGRGNKEREGKGASLETISLVDEKNPEGGMSLLSQECG